MEYTWNLGKNTDQATETESWIQQPYYDCCSDGYRFSLEGGKFRRSPYVEVFSDICRDGCYCKSEGTHQ